MKGSDCSMARVVESSLDTAETSHISLPTLGWWVNVSLLRSHHVDNTKARLTIYKPASLAPDAGDALMLAFQADLRSETGGPYTAHTDVYVRPLGR